LNGKRVLAASFKNRATKANSFGNVFAIATTWSALTIWVKKHLTRQIAARTVLLPIPVFYNWFRKSRNFAHFDPLDA
jgi:hypothetical protein